MPFVTHLYFSVYWTNYPSRKASRFSMEYFLKNCIWYFEYIWYLFSLTMKGLTSITWALLFIHILCVCVYARAHVCMSACMHCTYPSVCSLFMFCSTLEGRTLKLVCTHSCQPLSTCRISAQFQSNTALMRSEWHSGTVMAGSWHTLVIQCPVMIWLNLVCTVRLKKDKDGVLFGFTFWGYEGNIFNYVLFTFQVVTENFVLYFWYHQVHFSWYDFEILMYIFWNAVTSSLVDVERHFRGAYCLPSSPDCVVLHHRRQPSSYFSCFPYERAHQRDWISELFVLSLIYSRQMPEMLFDNGGRVFSS